MAATKDAFKRRDTSRQPLPEEQFYLARETRDRADNRTLIWAIAAVVIMLMVGYALAQRGTVKVAVQNPAGPQTHSSTVPSKAGDVPAPVAPVNNR